MENHFYTRAYSFHISSLEEIIKSNLQGVEKDPDKFHISANFNFETGSHHFIIRGVENDRALKLTLPNSILEYLQRNAIKDSVWIETRQNKDIMISFVISKTFNCLNS